MKRIELLFSAILVPVDYCMVVLAGLAAYALRFGDTVTGIRPAFYELSLSSYLSILLLAALGFLIIFALSGLYAIRSTKRFIDEVAAIFLACSTSVMAVIVLFFFQREFFSSRFIILSGWVLAVLAVSLGRLVIRTVQHALLARKIGVYRIALFGNGPTSTALVNLFRSRPDLGYDVIHHFPRVTSEGIDTLRQGIERDQNIEQSRSRSFLRNPFLDFVLQADPTLPRQDTERLVDFCNDHHIGFKYAADLLMARPANIAIETVGDIPVIEVKKTRLEGWGRILKRGFDLVLSLVFLVLLSPVLLITALAIRTDSRGPAILKLTRVGERGRKFSVFKFRSMVVNAHAMKAELLRYNERSGPLFKMKHDPRITRVGRFLRKTSIDELPQLINVLRGEMSLVGPRPHEPEEVAQYEKPHRALLTIKPGITGMAQISGRSDLDFHREARLDLYYIEHWSLRLDLSILFRTPLVVFRMKSAA